MFAAIDSVSHGILRALGAKSIHVDTGSGRVHAYDLRASGDASRGTYVLLHGMGTTATSYVAVVRRLKRRAKRIVLLELPGHGRSAAPTAGLDSTSLAVGVREALDHILPPDRAVVLGTSLGGAAALGFALDRPDAVLALVLASPAGAPLDEAGLAELRARFDLRSRADARRFFSELLHAPPLYLRALEKGLVSQLGRPLVQRFLASLDAKDFFSAEQMASLVPPTTVLWGDSDRVLPRSGLAFFEKNLPSGTRFERLDGVGHSPHLERPGLVADELVSAFERVSRR